MFNSLNWERSQTVTIENHQGRVLDSDGVEMQSQLIKDNKLIFLAEDIPSVGYKLFWLSADRSNLEDVTVKPKEYTIENQYLKVKINSKTGNVDSIFDKKNNKEMISKDGNELQIFEDKGQYWDAWNIDPKYEQKRLPDPKLESIEWIDTGLIRGVRVVKKFNKSTFTQDYILETDSHVLKIVNQIDWQETHVMVKAAFPLTIASDTATYEIPCGTIARTTKPQTEAEKAQWEVPALNWADITDESQNYGVSLLNDCKYGYDAKPSLLRLTLLRAATWPDPESDRGVHHFTYAIYPHKSDWRQAKTVQKGYELNTPLKALVLEKNKNNIPSNQQLPSTSQLLKISAKNVILTALKLSNRQGLIMRCYEANGKSNEITIDGDLNLQLGDMVDCLENHKITTTEESNKIRPYKIATWKLLD